MGSRRAALSILSSRGKFYSHFGSHFVEFDPAKRAFTLCRKTAPQMAMSMTEDQQGVIWSATYPQSGVASFNPKTREFRDYKHVYKQDWAEYPRAVAADDAGWVYLGVGSTACQIVALESKSGKATPLVPEEQRKHGTPSLYVGTDGKVYAQPVPGKDEKWVTLHEGRATPLAKKPSVTAKPISIDTPDPAMAEYGGPAALPGFRRVGARELLDRVELLGVRQPVAIHPESFVEAERVDDERVAFPPADRVAVVARHEGARMRTPVHVDRAQTVVGLVDDEDLLRRLDHLERLRVDMILERALRHAQAVWIVQSVFRCALSLKVRRPRLERQVPGVRAVDTAGVQLVAKE